MLGKLREIVVGFAPPDQVFWCLVI